MFKYITTVVLEGVCEMLSGRADVPGPDGKVLPCLDARPNGGSWLGVADLWIHHGSDGRPVAMILAPAKSRPSTVLYTSKVYTKWRYRSEYWATESRFAYVRVVSTSGSGCHRTDQVLILGKTVTSVRSDTHRGGCSVLQYSVAGGEQMLSSSRPWGDPIIGVICGGDAADPMNSEFLRGEVVSPQWGSAEVCSSVEEKIKLASKVLASQSAVLAQVKTGEVLVTLGSKWQGYKTILEAQYASGVVVDGEGKCGLVLTVEAEGHSASTLAAMEAVKLLKGLGDNAEASELLPRLRAMAVECLSAEAEAEAIRIRLEADESSFGQFLLELFNQLRRNDARRAVAFASDPFPAGK